MRKLLNTLYVMTESCYLSLDGENIVIQDGEKTLGRFPLHTLENIVCFTYKGSQSGADGRLCGSENRNEFFLAERNISGKGGRKRVWERAA